MLTHHRHGDLSLNSVESKCPEKNNVCSMASSIHNEIQRITKNHGINANFFSYSGHVNTFRPER